MIARMFMFFCVTVLSNIYVCKKYEGFLSLLNFNFSFLIFRVMYFITVALFFASMFYQETFSKHELPGTIVTYFVTAYLGIFMISLTLFSCFDIAFLVGRCAPSVLPITGTIYAGGLTVLLISVLATGYGMWNAKQVSLKEYEIFVNKTAQVQSVRLVLLSDIHLGTSVKKKTLENIVNRVNGLSPDIIAIGGDLIDHSTTDKLKEVGTEILSRLRAKYGIFYVFGNHEYYFGDEYKATADVRRAAKLLDDAAVLIDDAFYLVGRNDPTNVNRKTTAAIAEGLDLRKPLIMIEHQPNDIDANIAAGIDLQFSGHTHSGQLFPFNILVKIFNGLYYGHYKINGYQAIVTSGTGTWGFPIRIGSKNEIVLANIHFDGEQQ